MGYSSQIARRRGCKKVLFEAITLNRVPTRSAIPTGGRLAGVRSRGVERSPFKVLCLEHGRMV